MVGAGKQRLRGINFVPGMHMSSDTRLEGGKKLADDLVSSRQASRMPEWLGTMVASWASQGWQRDRAQWPECERSPIPTSPAQASLGLHEMSTPSLNRHALHRLHQARPAHIPGAHAFTPQGHLPVWFS